MNAKELIPNVSVPEGMSGPWKVERFTIKPNDPSLFLFNLRARSRSVQPGTYTRLVCGSEVVMSDTTAEKSDHYRAVRNAHGVILINGLGIGMVLNACLLKPGVERAIVIEKSEEVISLVAEHYHSHFGERVEIMHADAMTFDPPKGVRFGMVWHDIWPHICSDNLEDMKKLHRKYGRRADWQGSWCREECEYANRRWR